MSRQHTHDIDGALHDECSACDLIRELKPKAERERRESVAREADRKRKDDGQTHYYGDGCDDEHGRVEHLRAIQARWKS